MESLKNYTCEICGGELTHIEGDLFQCPYCKAKFYKETTLPEKLLIDLCNAGMDRNIQRFEDSLNKYDVIISQYPDCSDAYWGACLSDYGIQYEKDYDGLMIPTVHRYSEIPVFENRYYKGAVKFCKNEKELERIKASADEIEQIRADIGKTIGAEEPYDIFLCYKEKRLDNPREYASEFYWADDLYRKLRGEGYRVFFAKESLPRAKGDYEAHIFPALKSAKLMLILTSSTENVESTWVKNEWSRFIRFSKGNPEKRFKVISGGFNPASLPRELNKEQALNHDSIAWGMQLDDIIEDTFGRKKKAAEEARKREEALRERERKIEEAERRFAEEEQKRKEEEERRRKEEEARAQADKIIELERMLKEMRRSSAGASAVEEHKPSAPAEKQYKVSADGKYIEFGSYPQTKVSAGGLWHKLDKAAGKLPTEYDPGNWTSYKYYIKNNACDYMWYQDVTYEGEKYRGVYFTNYRPWDTSSSAEKYNTNQEDNGYNTDMIYWFKYEPLRWKILTEEKGAALLLCDNIIDSREFHFDSNNYKNSNIRKWLNESFFDTSFSDPQQMIVRRTTVDNSARTFGYSSSKDAGCESTEDFVFLLSYSEVITKEYGFNRDERADDGERERKSTDYAVCQGLDVTSDGYGEWWLRSPYGNKDKDYYYIGSYGNVTNDSAIDDTAIGVCPALWIDLGGDTKSTVDAEPKREETEVKPEPARTEPVKTEPVKTEKALEIPKINGIGSHIKLGTYGGEEIEWRVLATEGNSALVISEKCIDAKPFDAKINVWASSSLRKWLNGEFLNDALAKESARIKETKLEDTADKVFLLSTGEAEKHFENGDDMVAKPTERAKKNGIYVEKTNGASWWWLRSTGRYRNHAANVSCEGDVRSSGCYVDSFAGVRPALWIDLGGDTKSTVDAEPKREETVVKPEPAKTEKAPEIPKINGIGSRFKFGTYGGEEIEWRVLATEGNSALVISEKCIDAKPFDAKTNVWASSSLRKWLNGEFLNDALAKESARIKETKLEDTTDKVFLLSKGETLKYLKTNAERMASQTAHAIRSNIYLNRGMSWWWIRTPGARFGCVAHIDNGGFVSSQGKEVSDAVGGVRPAMWITM